MQRNDKLMLYRRQDFYRIRDWCLKNNRLFEDPCFDLNHVDIKNNTYYWRRPGDIVSNPELYVEGASRFDINQGALGDCWAEASMAVLAEYPDLVQNVVPSDQSFTSQYAGIFHFHIWRFGTWYDVVIDDRLPTYYDGRLALNHSVSANEFWTALLEKAYCKLLGENYVSAHGGLGCEALQDFTGGITETYRLKDVPKNFQNFLVESFARRSLLGVYIRNDRTSRTVEQEICLGLIRSHQYSVTGAVRVNIPGYGDIVLVRVRNPWGAQGWTGPWSIYSQEWSYIPESKKQELGIIFQDGGEFWMSFLDFVINFQFIDMCHLNPDSFIPTRTVDASGNQTTDTNLPSVSSWHLNAHRGSWVRGVSAGGVNYMQWNPQIKFTLSEADDDNHDGLCSVLIGLMQINPINYRLPIKFRIYKLHDPNNTTLDESFFNSNNAIAEVRANEWVFSRELVARHDLLPGVYCVIPYTYEYNRECNFLLRIYSEKRTEIEGMGYKIGLSPGDVTARDISPMKTAAIKVEDEQSELKLKEYFDKISGADKEVDWKELKTVLDITVMKNIHKSDDGNCGNGHFLLDIGAYIFSKVFRKSRKMDAYQTLGPEGFSYDVCRSMVALLDVDHSGKLGFNEFRHLWEEIKKWKTIYEKYSENTGGYLNSSGLKDALEATGFNFNRQTLSDIVHRYSTKDEKMSFDDFLHCTIKIKTMVKFFKSKDENNTNKVQLTLDEFLDNAIYS